MKLIDLHPEFLGAGGEGISNADGSPAVERVGVGVQFDCPCGCDSPCFVPFANPLDGCEPIHTGKNNGWQRTGDTFENLTLTPSILRTRWTDSKGNEHGCGWHGFIRNGEIVNA